MPDDDPVRIPVTGDLDLHRFRPSEAGEVLDAWFDECLRTGILTVRVVHGKGTGTLRSGVHAALDRHPAVESWTWPTDPGGWGATLVRLRPPANAGRGRTPG